MWSQQLCKSGKVSEFIADVQAGVPGVCTPGSLEAALTFLNGLPYAVASFRPGIDTITLPLSREGQLRDPRHGWSSWYSRMSKTTRASPKRRW